MERFYYFVDLPDGRVYYKDIKQANDHAQRAANESGSAVYRGDLDGGKSYFYPEA